MTGVEVCRAIRADPRTAGLPVLMVSASAFAGDVATGRAAGADDYLTKPFDNAELTARACALLRTLPGTADTADDQPGPTGA